MKRKLKYRHTIITAAAIAAAFLLSSCKSESKVEGNITTADSAAAGKELTIEALDSIIREDPLQDQNFAMRAELRYSNGDFNGALEDINIALSIDSVVADYYFKKAEYLLIQGKSGKAKEVLEKCLQFFPDNTEGLLKLAEIFLYVEQYKESMEVLMKVESIDKHIAYTYFIKSIIFKETGDTTRAIENLMITVDKEPDFYNAYIMLGVLHAARKDSLALAFYRNALRIIPNSIEAHYNLGLFYQEAGRSKEALDEYELIINEIDATYPFAHYNMGYVYLEQLRDYDKAILSFTKALEYKPNYVDALYNRGYCYECKGNVASARADYEATFVLVPNYELSIAGLNRLNQ